MPVAVEVRDYECHPNPAPALSGAQSRGERMRRQVKTRPRAFRHELAQ